MSVTIGIVLIEIVIGLICHCCHYKTSMIWCEQVMPMLMAIPKENRADCEIGVTYEKKEKR